MSLQEIRNAYSRKEISKTEFIDRMYSIHINLLDYATSLKNSGISRIVIEDDQLMFTSRETSYHKGGISFYCDIEDKRTTTLEAFNFGEYEAEDSAMLYKLLDSDSIVYDIGGNIGWYTNHMAALLVSGTVYAFEPIPETYLKLERNTALNGFKNIRLNNFAFSDKAGKLTFFYSPLMTGASSSKNITNNSDAIKVECETKTIDDFTTENNISRIDLIKCDVEGAEFFVFKGGKSVIEKHKPVVFSEMLRKWTATFNYHPNDIIKFFSDLGYSCFVSSNGKLSQIEEVKENTVETNFFFLHNEKHSDRILSLKVR